MLCGPLYAEKPPSSQLYGGSGNFRKFSPPNPGPDRAHNLDIVAPKMTTAGHTHTPQGKLGLSFGIAAPTMWSSHSRTSSCKAIPHIQLDLTS